MIPDGLYVFNRRLKIGYQTVVFPTYHRVSPVGTPPVFIVR